MISFFPTIDEVCKVKTIFDLEKGFSVSYVENGNSISLSCLNDLQSPNDYKISTNFHVGLFSIGSMFCPLEEKNKTSSLGVQSHFPNIHDAISPNFSIAFHNHNTYSVHFFTDIISLCFVPPYYHFQMNLKAENSSLHSSLHLNHRNSFHIDLIQCACHFDVFKACFSLFPEHRIKKMSFELTFLSEFFFPEIKNDVNWKFSSKFNIDYDANWKIFNEELFYSWEFNTLCFDVDMNYQKYHVKLSKSGIQTDFGNLYLSSDLLYSDGKYLINVSSKLDILDGRNSLSMNLDTEGQSVLSMKYFIDKCKPKVEIGAYTKLNLLNFNSHISDYGFNVIFDGS